MAEDGKYLGKIAKAHFGLYDGGRFGLALELNFEGHGTLDFKGTLATYPEEGAPITREEWREDQAALVDFMCAMLAAAKVTDVAAMVGKPIEVTVEGNTLKSWRILHEVL